MVTQTVPVLTVNQMVEILNNHISINKPPTRMYIFGKRYFLNIVAKYCIKYIEYYNSTVQPA